MSETKASIVALNSVPYFSPANYHKIIEVFGSAKSAIMGKEADLSRIEGISPKMASLIHKLEPPEILEREERYAQRLDATIFTLGDEGYPKPLASIFYPPPVISVAGEIRKKDEISIAVVGSRNASTYGKVAAEKIVCELIEMGITVVSGLARGIDGVAHRVALGGGGRTIAALGCGLNIYYPSEHRQLQKKIIEGGAVVSQFPFTQSPDRVTFPMRNRVISGLSLGVVVIEAGVKSGALITAYAALEDNREVFATPGPINSPKSAGSNKLIQKGFAKLVCDAKDIVDELPGFMVERLKGEQESLPLEKREKLTEEEGKVMANIDWHEARHIDYLVQTSGLPTNSVSAILLALELKGRVKQFAGKLFIQC